MGEGTSGVKRTPEELEREVESIRESMDPVLEELDTRRHELMDWKLQLKRHGPTLGKAVAVAAGIFMAVGVAKDVGGTMRRRMRRRSRRSPFDPGTPGDATM